MKIGHKDNHTNEAGWRPILSDKAPKNGTLINEQKAKTENNNDTTKAKNPNDST